VQAACQIVIGRPVPRPRIKEAREKADNPVVADRIHLVNRIRIRYSVFGLGGLAHHGEKVKARPLHLQRIRKHSSATEGRNPCFSVSGAPVRPF